MVLNLPWGQKTFKTAFFSFSNFLERKLKSFSEKARQSVQDHSNSKLVKKSVLEDGFEATSSSKTNVSNLWKLRLLFFLQTFEEVEAGYWESEEKRWKLFK